MALQREQLGARGPGCIKTLLQSFQTHFKVEIQTKMCLKMRICLEEKHKNCRSVGESAHKPLLASGVWGPRPLRYFPHLLLQL